MPVEVYDFLSINDVITDANKNDINNLINISNIETKELEQKITL